MNENLIKQSAPHVRQTATVGSIMLDVILALMPIYLVCVFYYGIRAFVLGAVGVLSCCAFSAIGAFASRREPDFSDFTPIITGMMIPLLMPADIDYYVVVAASAVAILVVKFPFGGTANNMFNPAAVGFASVALCWPQKIFTYPSLSESLEVFGENTAKSAQSAAYSLSIGAAPDDGILNLVIGYTPGPMGAVNIAVIVACGLFLIIRRAANWRTPAFFLATYSLLSLIFVRVSLGRVEAMLYEVFSGMAVFGAFFMLTEPVTSPKGDFSKIVAAIVSGTVAFLFRRFGGFEDGFVFALILMNVFSPFVDDISEVYLHLYRNGKLSLGNLRNEMSSKMSLNKGNTGKEAAGK